VRIELIVRGLCCLRPGVPGLSENISVRSIVGRFLEHSRIYRFGNPSVESAARAGRRGEAVADDDGASGEIAAARYFIGSADLMERNLDRRVEVLAPVLDPELRARLDETLELNLADDVSTWELSSTGPWHRVPRTHNISTQLRLQELAVERSRRRRSESHS
jgi:polyphosphate kinase